MHPPRCRCDCLMIAWPTGTGWRCLICDTAPDPHPLRRLLAALHLAP